MLKFLKYFLIIITCLLTLMAVWALYLEPNELIVKKVNLTVPNWHKEHENLKIIVLADIHTGSPYIDIKKLKRIVELTNKEKPDLVLLLGDYVIQGCGKFVDPKITAKIIGNIKAKYGIIAILGNHDWWYDGFKVIKALKANHIIVLENGVTKITNNNKSFWIAGVADLWTRKPDIKHDLKLINDNNPIILLSHSPDLFPIIPPRISLTLSGHTHGGQVTLPFLGSIVVPSEYGQHYARGLVVEKNRYLYVSSGIGTSILPVRFGNPPEILVLKLKSK